VGRFSPLAITLFEEYGDGIIFPDGTNTPPSDIRITESYDCPFDESKIETFDNGLMLAYIISFTLLTVTIIITGILYRKYWRMYVPPLKVRRNIGMNDYIVLLIVVIDFFQY
jgi:hypothetical protein